MTIEELNKIVVGKKLVDLVCILNTLGFCSLKIKKDNIEEESIVKKIFIEDDLINIVC